MSQLETKEQLIQLLFTKRKFSFDSQVVIVEKVCEEIRFMKERK